MKGTLFTIILIALSFGKARGQYKELQLILTNIDKPDKTIIFIPGDIISARTAVGKRNLHRKELKEVMESAIIVQGPDTVPFNSIMSITDKSLGSSNYHIGGRMMLAAGLSAGLFIVFGYAGESSIFYVGQLLTLSFSAFAIPFGLVNLIVGKVKNSRSFIVRTEWELSAAPNPGMPN